MDIKAKKDSLVEQVGQIIVQHPSSVYSSYLKPNLKKHKTDELKRNEFYKNIRKP